MLKTIFSISCLLNFLAIKYDRYLGICFPMNTYTKWRATSMKTILAIMWLTAFVVGLPEAFNFRAINIHDTLAASTFCFTSAYHEFQRSYQGGTSGLFILVFVVSLYCIARMILALSQSSARQEEKRGHKKTITLLIMVTATFGLCLLPHHILQILISADPNTYIRKFGLTRFSCVFEILQMLTFLNSALNPVIYNFTSSKFNVAFKEVLCMKITSGETEAPRSRTRTNDSLL